MPATMAMAKVATLSPISIYAQRLLTAWQARQIQCRAQMANGLPIRVQALPRIACHVKEASSASSLA